MLPRFLALACATALVTASFIGAAHGAEPKPADQSIKMDEPMAGKMKRPGMKKRDVKKSAAQKARTMKPMLEQEEKAMAREQK